jgi:hypothetical protein
MVEDQLGDLEPVYLTLEDVLGLHGLIIGATSIEAGDQLVDVYVSEAFGIGYL